MIEIPPEALKFTGLLMPHMVQRQSSMRRRNARFVHYTTAEVAASILRNNNVWMRNLVTMNDFAEVEHGKSCLFPAYKSNAGIKLRNFLNEIEENLDKRLEDLFNGWLNNLEYKTFITCFSEHRDSEDFLGRLSMWRAYGGSNGVALVFKNGPFLSPTDALKAYSSPVAYLDQGRFEEIFSDTVDALLYEAEFIKSLGSQALLDGLFYAFKFAVLCTKHPGFREEREWRIIYSPDFELSSHIKMDIEIVRGVPQQVCKIPLSNIPDEGLEGVDIPSLLDRVIIGPTDNQLPMLHAFRTILADCGIEDPDSKIFVSSIPLRHR